MITATKCIDGKRHIWKEANIDGTYKDSWCKKCGSITEFVYSFVGQCWERCKEGNDIYINIPECHK